MSEEILPTHSQEKRKKSWCNFADWSQPVFTVTGVFGSIGLIENIVTNETLDIVISSVTILSSLLAWYRVRRLGEANAIMDSVTDLKLQNDELEEQTNTLQEENNELKESNDQLNELENKLENDLKNLRDLLGIVDTAGKSVEEVQKELISTIQNLKEENDRHHRINMHQSFLVADENRDGKLEGNEIQILKDITLDEEIIDSNNDGIITKDEYIKPLKKKDS